MQQIKFLVLILLALGFPSSTIAEDTEMIHFLKRSAPSVQLTTSDLQTMRKISLARKPLVEPISDLAKSPKLWTPQFFTKEETLERQIDRISRYYGVSRELMTHIVNEESMGNPKAIGDMNITCKKTGKPVRARGLVQITECYFPEVTDEQAFDPEFALEFLARHIYDGRCYLWSTCPH